MFGLFAPILGVLPAEVNFFTGWAQAMNVGAIVLLIVGVILLICEMLIPGIGIAGVCGVISCVAGLIVGSDSIAQAAFTLAILLVILLIACGWMVLLAGPLVVSMYLPRTLRVSSAMAGLRRPILK